MAKWSPHNLFAPKELQSVLVTPEEVEFVTHREVNSVAPAQLSPRRNVGPDDEGAVTRCAGWYHP